MTLQLNGPMRVRISRLLMGLPDDTIRTLAGPVASSIKALGEALAAAVNGSKDQPVEVTGHLPGVA